MKKVNAYRNAHEMDNDAKPFATGELLKVYLGTDGITVGLMIDEDGKFRNIPTHQLRVEQPQVKAAPKPVSKPATPAKKV